MDLRIVAKHPDHRWRQRVGQDRKRHGHRQSPAQGLPGKVIGTPPIAGPERLRDHHRRANRDRPKQRDEQEDDRVGDPDGRQGGVAGATDQDRVHRQHQHLQHVFGDHWRGQPQDP
jgi:hypothetical protein